MKTNIYRIVSPILLAIATLTGCTKTESPLQEKKEVELTVSAGDVITTYSSIGDDSELQTNGCKIRCVLEITDQNGNVVRYMTQYTDSKSRMPQFSTRLIGDASYTFLMWCDVVDRSTETGVYSISDDLGLRSVTMEHSTTDLPDNKTLNYISEAFFGVKKVNISQDTKFAITLTRVVAKIALYLKGTWDNTFDNITLNYDFEDDNNATTLRNVINLHTTMTSVNEQYCCRPETLTIRKNDYNTSLHLVKEIYTFIPSSKKIEYDYKLCLRSGDMLVKEEVQHAINLPVNASTTTNLITNISIINPLTKKCL